MILKELTKVFDADTHIIIDMLSPTNGKTLYNGTLMGYKKAIKDYDDWEVSSCQIMNNTLSIIIE